MKVAFLKSHPFELPTENRLGAGSLLAVSVVMWLRAELLLQFGELRNNHVPLPDHLILKEDQRNR